MMREVLIFVSGVTVGGFLGYKIIEKKYSDKLETEVNRRIDEYVLNNKKEEKHTEPTEIKKENVADKINYNSVTKNYISSEDNEEDDEETNEEDDGKEDEPEVNDYISDDSSRDPYEITEEEYDDNSNEFEKESLYYYRGNYTLVDDSDNVVDTEDADILLGSDWVDLMNNNGIIYIRNEKVKTDYEIVVNSGVYPL